VQIFGTPETVGSSGGLVSASHAWSSGFAAGSGVTCCSS